MSRVTRSRFSMHSPTKRKAPVRRKLQLEEAPPPAERGEEGQQAATSCPLPLASGPLPSAAECRAMQRQDSAWSTLTDMGVQEEPSAPSTPEQSSASRVHPGAPTSWEAVEAPLGYALQAWRQELVRLQPLVKLGDEVLLGALALVRELATVCPNQRQLLAASPPHLYTYLAAALWTTAKLSGVRTQIPNRSLVSQATHINAQALSDFELDLLESLDWEVAGVLRRHGLLM